MTRNTDHRQGYRVTFTDGGKAHYCFVSNKTQAKAQAARKHPGRRVAAVQRG